MLFESLSTDSTSSLCTSLERQNEPEFTLSNNIWYHTHLQSQKLSHLTVRLHDSISDSDPVWNGLDIFVV